MLFSQVGEKTKKIYAYIPESTIKFDYVIERNINLAKYLAEVTGKQFLGTFNPALTNRQQNYYVPFGPLSHPEAEKLGIKSGNQVFGSVTDLLYAQKSIFHLPITQAEFVPANFPYKFADFIQEKNIAPPGFSAFSVKDSLRAYESLSKEGYMVRFKDPSGSSMRGQYLVKDQSHLLKIVQGIRSSILKSIGVVLEANVVGLKSKELLSISAGWITIDCSTYSYTGTLKFGETGTEDKYLGTRLFMVRGKPGELKKYIEDDKYAETLEQLIVLEKAIGLLPNVISTRNNFNLVRGKIEGKRETGWKTYCTEQTFRIGGATGAELMAMDALKNNPGVNVATATCQLRFNGENIVTDNPIKTRVFFEGEDSRYGKVRVVGTLDEMK